MKVLSSLKFSLLFAGVCSTALAADSGGVSFSDAPRGIVVARSKAVVGSELVARIKKIPFKSGERFVAGNTILEFDCRRYEAELGAARAEERAAELGMKENQELRRHNAVGLIELEISEAKYEQAKAKARAQEIRINQCVLKAPFSGRVVEKLVNEFEIPGANEPLLKIIDDKNVEIELIVPSNWLSWLRVGAPFTFHLDETLRSYNAVVQTISAEVDPISQTVRIKGEFKNIPDEVLPGMSGSAVFESMSAFSNSSGKG